MENDGKLKNKKINSIMMVGPIIGGKGGISEVVTNYKNAGILNTIGIDYYSTYSGGSKFFKIKYFIASFLKIASSIGNYRVLHVHSASKWSFRRLSLIILLAKIFKLKTIFHLHGGGFKSYYRNSIALEKFYIRFIYNLSDRIIVLSNIWKFEISQICDNKNINVIPNFVNKRNKSNILKTINENKKIIFLGSLRKKKGVYDLIDSIEMTIKRNTNIELILCGDGESKEIKYYVNNKGLKRYVSMPGWVSGKTKDNYLAEAYIFVLPSYIEAFPISILEAMSYGIPVISTEVGGIPDIIEDSKNGFLIKPGDVYTLSQNIIRLIENKKIWQKISDNSIKTIQNNFSKNTIINKLEKLYKEI